MSRENPEAWEVESLCRRLAKMDENDPDRKILRPGIEPFRVSILGVVAIAADGHYAPVELWTAYARLAEKMIRAGIVEEP